MYVVFFVFICTGYEVIQITFSFVVFLRHVDSISRDTFSSAVFRMLPAVPPCNYMNKKKEVMLLFSEYSPHQNIWDIRHFLF